MWRGDGVCAGGLRVGGRVSAPRGVRSRAARASLGKEKGQGTAIVVVLTGIACGVEWVNG